MKIKVVCFDIDGTLYPKWVTDRNLMRSFFPSPVLAWRYQQFRKEVRKREDEKTIPENAQGFRKRQAAWVSNLGKRKGSDADIERTYRRIENQFYASWRKTFSRLTPFARVRSTMEELHRRGIRIAALSDFPVERKLEALGVADLVGFSACTEESGYLKPHPAPFRYICRELGVTPEEVLYVGDSCKKDMVGASRAGMKTCLIAPKAKHDAKREKLHHSCPEADHICADYTEFSNMIEELLT